MLNHCNKLLQLLAIKLNKMMPIVFQYFEDLLQVCLLKRRTHIRSIAFGYNFFQSI